MRYSLSCNVNHSSANDVNFDCSAFLSSRMFLLNFSTIKVRKTDICAQFCNPTVQEDINILQITELFTGTMNRPDEVIPVV